MLDLERSLSLSRLVEAGLLAARERGHDRKGDEKASAARAVLLAIVASSEPLIAIFGPTGVGKTAVAIEIAERLRESGEDPVAISADALQVYRGLEILTRCRYRCGARTA